MKSRTSSSVFIASILLWFFALASACLAATHPLNNPKALAVDANGNLYVANVSGNNILIYNTNYVQQTSKTITSNIANPTGIAFDTAGNLWVANYSPSNGSPVGSIAEYTDGKQNTSATVSGITEPTALAVDSGGNVWVVGNNLTILLIAPDFAFQGKVLLKDIGTTSAVYGITAANGMLSWGSNSGVNVSPVSIGLLENFTNPTVDTNDTGYSLATDASGKMYMANFDGSVNVLTPPSTEKLFVQLNFLAAGIAIDNVRGRVYLSNETGNSIAVYSTAGELLHTIE
jgi:hypothetical protein